MTGTTNEIAWTLADNTNTMVTATSLRMVVAKIAERSNILHVKYRDLKLAINAIVDNTELTDEEKIEQINAVTWNEAPEEEPTEEPTPTPDPTEEPTPDPDPTVEPEPTVDPEPTPEPDPEPTESPEEDPAPVINPDDSENN